MEKKEWYILVVYPQREIAIRDRLQKLAQNPHLKELIEDVRVVTEIVEDNKGKKKEKVHKHYTQYVFIKMIRNDITYHAVKVEGVRHILGNPEPTPLPPHEVIALFGEEALQ